MLRVVLSACFTLSRDVLVVCSMLSRIVCSVRFLLSLFADFSYLADAAIAVAIVSRIFDQLVVLYAY